MNTILAGSPPVAQGSGLTDVLLAELQKLTGVMPGEWLGSVNESDERRAQRLELLADAILRVAGRDEEQGRYVAGLHRLVLDLVLDLAPTASQPLADDVVFGPDAETALAVVERMLMGRTPSPGCSVVPDARVLAGVGAS